MKGNSVVFIVGDFGFCGELIPSARTSLRVSPFFARLFLLLRGDKFYLRSARVNQNPQQLSTLLYFLDPTRQSEKVGRLDSLCESR